MTGQQWRQKVFDLSQQNKAGNGCQDIDNGEGGRGRGHGRCASSVKCDNPGRRTKAR